MEITKEMVGYVAELSRIELDEAQTEKMQRELCAIVEYMDILSTLDTTETEPLSHIFPMTNVMREDEVRRSADRVDILRNLPEAEDGMPVVPRTID